MLATSTWYCCIALEKGRHGASDSRCSRCRASAKVWGSCDGLASSKPEGNHFQKCIAKVIPEMTMMLVSLTLTWMAPQNGWLSPNYSPFGAKGLFSMGETVRFRMFQIPLIPFVCWVLDLGYVLLLFHANHSKWFPDLTLVKVLQQPDEFSYPKQTAPKRCKSTLTPTLRSKK